MTIRTVTKEERPYLIDPSRKPPDITPQKYPGRIGSGIVINAAPPQGVCGQFDIAQLDTESFNRFLRSKGGRNDLAEDILRNILGHPVGGRGD